MKLVIDINEEAWRQKRYTNPMLTSVIVPSVHNGTPLPKGQWQQDKDGTFLCSECGSGYKEQPTIMGKPMFEYCPHCGADMRESEEDE